MANDDKIIMFPVPEEEPGFTTVVDVDEIYATPEEVETMLEEEPKKKFKDIELPSGLEERYVRLLVVAGGFLLATIVFTILLKTPRMLFGLVGTAYFIYMAIEIKLSYRAGLIQEIALLCTSVTTTKATKSAKVMFRTNEELPSYYEFRVPIKESDNFTPNVGYVIYFNIQHPKQILGYVQV